MSANGENPNPKPAKDRLDKRTLAFVLIGTLLTGMGLWILFRYNPEDVRIFPRCPLYMLTGLKCPGCGTARALHCSLNGEFRQAFAYNPILVVAVPFLGALMASPKLRHSVLVCWLTFVVIIAYMIFRNVYAF